MAKYSDFASASADGVIHYWNFEEQSLTVTDKIGSWDGTVYVSDQADRPAANVTGSDVIVASELGFALDMSATVPASPGNYEDFYITPVDLGVLSGATAMTQWSIRVRFNYRGMLGFLATTSVFPAILWLADNFWLTFENDGKLYAYTNGPNYLGTATAVTQDVWHEVVATYDGTTFRWYLDGSEVGSAAESTSLNFANASSYIGGKVGLDDQADAIVDEVAVWSRALTATEALNLWNAGTAEPLVGAATPLEVAIDETLAITAEFRANLNTAVVGLDSMLGLSFSGTAFQDWTAQLNPAQISEIYLLTITGSQNGVTDLEVPISNWQATNQAGARSSYIQAVIPAANNLLSSIEARQDGDIVIRKGFRLPDGTAQSEEILRSNFETLRWDQGRSSLSVTISGYMAGKQSQTGSRTLKGVRTLSLANGKHRVRCDVDLFLQPGMTVTANGKTFTADYISYFVSESDKFCEVSER